MSAKLYYKVRYTKTAIDVTKTKLPVDNKMRTGKESSANTFVVVRYPLEEEFEQEKPLTRPAASPSHS